MSKKAIIDKIKEYKEKHQRKILSLALASASVVFVPTSEYKHYEFRNLQCSTTINNIKLYKSNVSADDFYKNISYNLYLKEWRYISNNEGNLSISKNINHKFWNGLRKEKNKKRTPVFEVDTFTFTYLKKNKQEDVIYNLDRDTENIPAMGLQNEDKIIVRHFVVDEKLTDYKKIRLKRQLDTKYNDEYNQTTVHEFQHFLNSLNGVSSYGLSVEQLYLLRLHDEVSANIKQLLAQRTNFLQKNDLEYIGDRFSLYREEIEKKSISPSLEKIDEQEQNKIALLIPKQWEEEKRNLYEDRLISITENFYKNGLIKYNAENNDKLYQEILNKIYTFELQNGDSLNLTDKISEFNIPKYTQEKLDNIKKSIEFSELDKLGEIQDKYGKEAVSQYIRQKKKEIIKRERQEKEPCHLPISDEDIEKLRPSKEGIIRYGKRKER